MRGTLMPCDWAQAINGKLYAQGIGWTRIASGRPTNFGLGFMIHVAYTETNKRHHFALRLETEDGAAYPPEKPIVVEADFEIGRPPGMRAGEESVATIATNMNQVMFLPGGYVWNLLVNDEQVAFYPFTAS